MIHVKAVEPQTSEWKKWREAVEKAKKKLKSAKDVDDDLYKGGREAIFNLFHGKCAYCEMDLAAGQRFGDVEHFRPKGRVTDENYKLVYVDDKMTAIHPGYFWLAYEWQNLFPACLSCNRPGTDPDGTKAGKFDRFPIAGRRAVKDDDPLPPEQPLLLNPYVDDPNEHLTFDPVTGIVGAKTDRGAATIRILGLNREGLVEMRRRMAKFAKDNYVAYVEATLKGNEEERAERKTEFMKFERGEAPYSAFAREAIRRVRELARAAARD